jgi:hypothetical protein
MQKSAEKNPKVKSVESTSEEPSLILECVVNSSQDNFRGRSELVADVVLDHAKLAALGVFGFEPLDEAGFVDIFQAAFAIADLF